MRLRDLHNEGMHDRKPVPATTVAASVLLHLYGAGAAAGALVLLIGANNPENQVWILRGLAAACVVAAAIFTVAGIQVRRGSLAWSWVGGTLLAILGVWRSFSGVPIVPLLVTAVLVPGAGVACLLWPSARAFVRQEAGATSFSAVPDGDERLSG